MRRMDTTSASSAAEEGVSSEAGRDSSSAAWRDGESASDGTLSVAVAIAMVGMHDGRGVLFGGDGGDVGDVGGSRRA
jgi:hypothetical protein